MSFSKSKRLVDNKQFKDVLARGVRVGKGMLMLYVAENDCGYPRLGVSVGKSYGKAVVRNRLKRLLREAFRQNQDQIPAGFDYLFVVSPGRLRQEGKSAGLKTAQPAFEQINASFLALAAEAGGLIKNKKGSR